MLKVQPHEVSILNSQEKKKSDFPLLSFFPLSNQPRPGEPGSHMTKVAAWKPIFMNRGRKGQSSGKIGLFIPQLRQTSPKVLYASRLQHVLIQNIPGSQNGRAYGEPFLNHFTDTINSSPSCGSSTSFSTSASIGSRRHRPYTVNIFIPPVME